ncbi:SsgA family sporulation/cell division regulator [Streptomyces sp. NPDC052023]|uniref:SsgA family sporulation/cell division regulator n=1 Tax=Streptomyces sp. NPDC052023 TaxID=3365681 RepID=UPI0037D90C25
MNSSRTLFRELSVQLVASPEVSFSVSMSLRYEPGDPYAVRAAFTVVGSDETVEWIIGRDLLTDGLEGPAGEGDVRVWPAGEHDRREVCILFSPPSGTALLKAPAREIRMFLRETESVVPRGGESRYVDWHALLAHFLAEG